MRLRGMSSHGFQLIFAVEQEGVRHLVTTQFYVFYMQTSDQTLPEAMATVCLVMSQIGRDFPWLRSGYVISDKCNTLQAFEQIIFVRQGNLDGWTTASHSQPLLIRISRWGHSEAQCGKDRLDAHFGFVALVWMLFLKLDGDITSPRQMFEAAKAYPIANTTFILADTTHAGLSAKFNIPKLSVQSVHVYEYNENGNVELYHHTGLKKRGMYKIYGSALQQRSPQTQRKNRRARIK